MIQQNSAQIVFTFKNILTVLLFLISISLPIRQLWQSRLFHYLVRPRNGEVLRLEKQGVKQFVLGVPSEEQPCCDDKLLSNIRADIQRYAQRDDVAESELLRTPLTDGGAADSEPQGELVLRARPLLSSTHCRFY